MSYEAKITVEIKVEDEAIQASINEAVKDAEEEAQVKSGGLATGDEGGGGLDFQGVVGKLGTASPMALMRMLAPFLGPAAVILLAPIVAKFVVDILIAPGGPFDTRFRREIEKEQFGFYDRQTQYDTQYGYRNVIIQGYQSFLSNQGVFHASTFKDVMQGTGTQYRLSRIEIDDKALGIRDY